jgi:hypothetical protein
MSYDKKLAEASEEELAKQLAEKRAAKFAGQSLYAAEEAYALSSQQDELRMMQALFDAASAKEGGKKRFCPKCRKAVPIASKRVQRRVQTLGGEAILRRNYHRCDDCTFGFYPLDIELQLSTQGECSARMAKLILDFGLHGTFESAAVRFTVHHGRSISENLVRLVIERAGTAATTDSMLPHRLRKPAASPPDKLLISVDGSMLPTRGADAWRETKLGIVVRDEHHSVAKGRGLISEARFVARMTGVDEFRQDLTRLLSLERAWDCKNVAFVGDGALWIWNMAQEICPNAVQIVDFMHAVATAVKPAEWLFPDEPVMRAIWKDTIVKMLRLGRAADLVTQLQQCAFAARGAARKALVDAAKYFAKNLGRMQYPDFAARGFPIGSGMIESAHRYVLQARMKLAGQHWDPIRADRLAQLRAALATCGPGALYDAIFPRQVA